MNGAVASRWARWTGWVIASAQTWKERVGGAVLIAGATALIVAGDRLTLVQTLLGAGLLVVLGMLLARQGWFTLFGPILFYDLVRNARRRVVGMRCVYTSLLLLTLFIVCSAVFENHAGDPWAMFHTDNVPPTVLAQLAASFTATVLGAQLIVGCALAPLSVAAAIPEEKQRRTLEFILATDLRNREIVLGVLLSRLGQVWLLLLAGLPILCLLQLLGGVEPELVLVGFGVTALTMLSFASLALLNSIYARRPITAILATYAQVVVYLAISGASKWGVVEFSWLGGYPTGDDWDSPIHIDDVVGWLGIGNLGVAGYDLVEGLKSGAALHEVLWPLLTNYCWFHGVLTAGCLGWAMLRLRAVALKQAGVAARQDEFPPGWRWRWLLNWWPLLWKETRAGRRPHWVVRLGRGLLIFAGVVSLAAILGIFVLTIPEIDWRELRLIANRWVRVVGMAMAGLLLLQVAGRSAGSIAGERDRQTLDTLLTTPLGTSQIVLAKWLGSIIGSWRAWVWLSLIWLAGWYSGGLQAADVPMLFLACLVYAILVASLGIWISARGKSTARSLTGTLAGLFLLWAGHWGVIPVAMWFWNAYYDPAVEMFEAYSLTPPVALDFLASRVEILTQRWWMIAPNLADPSALDDYYATREWCWVGLIFWASIAVALFLWAIARFGAAIQRQRGRKKTLPPIEAKREPLLLVGKS
jgi:ABC-type transport system involved in multi-copper enzyme maturation permease subunit